MYDCTSLPDEEDPVLVILEEPAIVEQPPNGIRQRSNASGHQLERGRSPRFQADWRGRVLIGIVQHGRIASAEEEDL